MESGDTGTGSPPNTATVSDDDLVQARKVTEESPRSLDLTHAVSVDSKESLRRHQRKEKQTWMVLLVLLAVIVIATAIGSGVGVTSSKQSQRRTPS